MTTAARKTQCTPTAELVEREDKELAEFLASIAAETTAQNAVPVVMAEAEIATLEALLDRVAKDETALWEQPLSPSITAEARNELTPLEA